MAERGGFEPFIIGNTREHQGTYVAPNPLEFQQLNAVRLAVTVIEKTIIFHSYGTFPAPQTKKTVSPCTVFSPAYIRMKDYNLGK